MPATFATTPTDGTLSLTHAKQFPRPRARPWSSPATLSSTPSFTIENDRFILDGKPFQIISGAIHYFRVHPDLWLDRLARCKALGLNTVEVYIPWNYHEPSIGEYSWSGAADFDLFISLAEDLGLMVLVRAGPYICAEWDFGGLPAWLASSAVAGGGGQMKIRSSDPFYLAHVDRWWRVLLPRLAPRMRAAGGPVLMVQIENEFGFCLGGNDDAYLQHLAGLAREILGKEATLFTTDSPHAVTGGTLKDDTVFTAVDFGPGWFSPEEYFATQKTMNPPGKSPPMDSEFYTGWLSHWGEGMANTSSVLTAIDADILLRWANGTGSLNLYMAHGGTNFGFWAGANVENDGRYEPHITSYDYDGPISESGQYNQPGIGGDGSKYHLMREVFENFTGIEPPEIPDEPIIREYGKVKLHAVDSIMAAAPAAPIISDLPLPMEEYGQSQGIIIYRTMITLSDYSLRTTEMNENDGSEAVLNFVVPPSDYTTVLLDGKVQGKLIRGGPANLTLSSYSSLLRDGKKGHATLEIMVEAMGRRNFGCENGGWDTKGIQSTDIRLNGKPLPKWEVFPIDFEDLSGIPTEPPHTATASSLFSTALRRSLSMLPSTTLAPDVKSSLSEAATFFRGSLHIKGAAAEAVTNAGGVSHLACTFLDTTGLGKGIAWVNGFNLGWYWPTKGPQMTLYVPGPVLREGRNDVLILELEKAAELGDKVKVSFVDEPNFYGVAGGGGTTNQGGRLRGNAYAGH